MNTAIYTLTSTLHDPLAVDALTKEFLSALHIPYLLKGDDFSDYGAHDLNVIYVRTGGTEGMLIRNQAAPDLFRTQLGIRLNNPTDTDYFLTNPIGNHHVIATGLHAAALKAFLKTIDLA